MTAECPFRKPCFCRKAPIMDSKTPSGERIAKTIARAGLASRRDAEKMILAGRVRVNGRRYYIASPERDAKRPDKS